MCTCSRGIKTLNHKEGVNLQNCRKKNYGEIACLPQNIIYSARLVAPKIWNWNLRSNTFQLIIYNNCIVSLLSIYKYYVDIIFNKVKCELDATYLDHFLKGGNFDNGDTPALPLRGECVVSFSLMAIWMRLDVATGRCPRMLSSSSLRFVVFTTQSAAP